MGMGEPTRVSVLTRSLREAMDDSRLTVRVWRSGVDFWADIVETDEVVGVIRSPRAELVDTSYEGVVDFGAVIEKEVRALELMSAAGIPVPEVLGWQRTGRAGESSWILLSFVPHDDDPDVPLARLGELARRLHAIRPRVPGLSPPPSWAEFVWRRLRQRLAAARSYCALPADADLEGGVTELLTARGNYATSLLHMDLRAANVCVKNGNIAALIDVANCIVGDPLMELGRVRAYGLLCDDFLSGYGLDLDRLSPEEMTLLDIYELDTAALLTVVAVEEFDDRALHREQALRAEHLATRIVGGLAAIAT